MRKLIIILILIVAVGAYACTGLVFVDETEFVLIKQFGRPVRFVLEPGLQFKWPSPFQTAVRLDNRIQVFEDPAPDQPAKEYLTKDKKNVEVASFTCWRIKPDVDSVQKYLESVRDVSNAQVQLSDIIKSQFNSKLGSTNFDELISTEASKRRWSELVDDIRTTCAKNAAENYGIEVLDLRILRLNFPAQNRVSVFNRMRAERDRIAQQYRSEGEAEAMKIRADAMAKKAEIDAAATEQAETIRGQADAEAARIYGEALSAAPEFYQFLRTLQSYEKGIDRNTILILPSDAEYFRLLTQPNTKPEALAPPTLVEPTTTDDRATEVGMNEDETPNDGRVERQQPTDPES